MELNRTAFLAKLAQTEGILSVHDGIVTTEDGDTFDVTQAQQKLPPTCSFCDELSVGLIPQTTNEGLFVSQVFCCEKHKASQAEHMKGAALTLKKDAGMPSSEYMKWEEDARHALARRYTSEEISIVISWFRGIRGADEEDLMGREISNALVTIWSVQEDFDLYNSLMTRLFLYAPRILQEHRELI